MSGTLQDGLWISTVAGSTSVSEWVSRQASSSRHDLFTQTSQGFTFHDFTGFPNSWHGQLRKDENMEHECRKHSHWGEGDFFFGLCLWIEMVREMDGMMDEDMEMEMIHSLVSWCSTPWSEEKLLFANDGYEMDKSWVVEMREMDQKEMFEAVCWLCCYYDAGWAVGLLGCLDDWERKKSLKLIGGVPRSLPKFFVSRYHSSLTLPFWSSSKRELLWIALDVVVPQKSVNRRAILGGKRSVVDCEENCQEVFSI